MILSELSTLPSWVGSALEIPSLGLSDQESVITEPGNHADLCTLRQEKSLLLTTTRPDDAWWTCSACPQPKRWLKGATYYWCHSIKNDVGCSYYNIPAAITEGNEWTIAEDEFAFLKVVRCKRCNRRRGRHGRAQASLGKVLRRQMIHMGTSARFVTITAPRETIAVVDGIIEPGDLADLVKKLKGRMYNFTRTAAYKDKVIGAVEFYEQTFRLADDGQSVSVNTHIHAVWLGQYWDQGDLQDAWGNVVHITKPRNRKTVMRYISKYVTKDPVPGTRAKETRGVLRG